MGQALKKIYWFSLFRGNPCAAAQPKLVRTAFDVQVGAMTVDDIRAILRQNFAPWILDLGIEPLEIGTESSLFRMPLGDHIARVGGIACGQSLAALADTAMVLAAIARQGELTLYATTNLDTQFLRPGTGSAVMCRASIVRAGKSLVFTRAEMSEEQSGKPIATANATLFAP